MGLFPTSDDAPAELLERLEDVGRFWKGDRESNRVLFRQIGLQDKSIVVSVEHRKRFQCPRARPIEVAFEPVQLDESSSTLRELAALATESECTESGTPRPMHGVIRHWLRLGVPAGGFMLLLVHTLRVMVQNGPTSTTALILLASTLISFGLLAAIPWIRNCNWFVVPGGIVLCRRSLLKREGSVALLHQKKRC